MLSREKFIGQLDLAIYYGFHLVVFSIPLVFLVQVSDTFSLPKLTLLRIETVIILSLWILKGLLSNSVEIKRTKLDWPILIFLALALISTLSSIHITTSLLGKYFRYGGLLTLINCAILFFLASQTFSNWRRVEAILRTMVITTTLIATYGILQYLGFDFINWGMTPWEGGRSFSTLGNPVFLGGYLALMLPIILGKYLSTREPLDSILYGSAFLLCSASVVTTFSRGGWLASLVGLLVLALLVGRKVFFSRKVGLIFLGLGIVFLLILISNYQFVSRSPESLSLTERVSSIAKPGAGSFGARLEIWKVVPKIVAQRPFFGWGPDTFHLSYPLFGDLGYIRLAGRRSMPDNAHNYFLQLAVSQGILGLLAFLWVIIVFVAEASRPPEYGNLKVSATTSSLQPSAFSLLHAGFLAGVVGYLAYLLSGINALDSAVIFWILLGFISINCASQNANRFTWSESSWLYRFAIAIMIFLLVFAGLSFTLKPLLADIHFAEAENLARYGSLDLSAEEYNLALRLNPYLDIYPRRLGDLYVWGPGRRALSTAGKGGTKFFNQAVKAYHRAQQVNPLEPHNYAFLGELYLRRAQLFDPVYYSLAEKELRQAQKLNPYWADVHTALGIIYLETKRYENALREFQAVVEIDPQDIKALLYLGRSYEDLKNKNKAIQAYSAIFQLDPANEEAKQALLRLGK